MNDPDSLDNRDPRFITKVMGVFDRTIRPYHRAEVRGLDRIPQQKGLIYVGNHNGFPYMSEAFLFKLGLFKEYGVSRHPYILIHPLTMKLPLLNQFFTRYSGVRATMQNAERVLQAGHPLLIYPGGDAELMRPYRERTRLRFNGRTSYIRLALKFGLPIVPVAAVGGHSTAMILDDLPWLAEALGVKKRFGLQGWPLMLSIPWGLTLGAAAPPYIPWPSKIIVEVLEPIVFRREDVDERDHGRIAACAAEVERTIESALSRLEAERLKLERPPLVMLKEAATRGLQWIEEHGRELLQSISAATPRKPPRSAPGDAGDDVALFRQMLARSGGNPRAPEPGVLRVAGPQKAAKPRKPRLDEPQIQAILEQARNGKSVSAVCRESGISESTFYRWRARHPAGNRAGDRTSTKAGAGRAARGRGRSREARSVV